MKWPLALLLASLLLLIVPASQAQPAPPANEAWGNAAARGRLEPALLKQILAGRPDELWPVIVTLREERRLTTDQRPPTFGAPRGAERAALVNALRAEAALGQRALRAFLAGEQSTGRVEDVRPFWIFNGLALRAAPQTLCALALRDDVELIRADEFKQWIPSFTFHLLPSTFHFPPSTFHFSLSPEWGIRRVRADQVWSAFNNTGEGVVVANLDTGVDFQHEALNANYRGNLGKNLYQHAGNWFDATGEGALYPVDSYGHGTHTMGTLAGQRGIGVAPGARWIAARVFNSQGYAYNSWIHAGFEWIMAPNGDPALAPDVLSNSWSNPSGGSTEFEADLARLRQAGIVVVFSAGNEGPNSRTVGSPASLRGAFAVGATDADDEVAWFSARGPSPWQEIKPQVVAPGVNVRSSVPGGAYALYSGTSMSAPHVAGAAALMLAAHPALTITATENILMRTAVPLGEPVPNNTSGWGLIDAYAAVQTVAGAGALTGMVLDAASRLPLPGAAVTIQNYDSGRVLDVRAGADGRYRAGVAAGPYSISAAAFGYLPDTEPHALVITGSTTVVRNLLLPPLPTGVLRGVLTDTQSGLPTTVTISALGAPVSQTAYGQYHLDLPAGAYVIQARSVGYRVVTATAVISAGRVTRLDFGMIPTQRILLVNSGAWYHQEYPEYFRQALDELGYAYDERRIKHPPADAPTSADLLKYDAVIWSSPQDSPGYIGAAQALEQFLDAGGHLLLSGQDVAFWDGGGALSFAPYLSNYLKTRYVRDDAGSRAIVGRSGDLMSGLAFGIAGGGGADNQRYPDEIAVTEPDYAAPVLAYLGDGSAGQKVGLCLPYRALLLAFGYEAIDDAAQRREVMRRALDYFVEPRQAEGLSVAATSLRTQTSAPGGVLTFTARARNTGEAGLPVAYTAALRSAGWTATLTPTQFMLAPCASQAMTIQVNVPDSLGLDARNPLTLTVVPTTAPWLAQTLTFVAKTPAPVLLVDDGRWYDSAAWYTQSLDQIGAAYDVWRVPRSGVLVDLNGPALERLQWYPLVIWFTGYDWYMPLNEYDEQQLAAYLDGGGRLMLSSAFYLDVRGYSAFARQRLGALNYTYGMTSTQAYGSPEHPLGAGFEPVKLVNPFPRAGFFTLDYALEPSSEAQTAWRGDHHYALAIARSQPGNRLVFWGIPFEALPAGARANALRRTLGWLGPLGDSSVQVDPPVVSAGAPANVVVTVRNNLMDTTAAFTATLPPQAQPVAGTLPPGVVYLPDSNSIAWSGSLAAGASRAFAFQVAASETPGTLQLPGKVVFCDQVFGCNYEQPLALRAHAPDLRASSLQAPPIWPFTPATVTMRIRNNGTGPAAAPVVTGLIPLEARVITDSVRVDGPGTARAWARGAAWQGALEVGQAVTVTYQITIPLAQPGQALPVEMLAWDGAGGAWEWRSWMTLRQNSVYLPLALK